MNARNNAIEGISSCLDGEEYRVITISQYQPVLQMISQCVRFEPNFFNKGKCKNCYKSKEQHSVDTLEKAKIFSDCHD
ncbi:hypothetical protein NECAME_14784 [Necator americanus]|uniref:Uncharacterized protein n=1 Tax=Necator americanus TaxID=51031 RepID=W2SLK0_NECAM|nr:hypothetical protein NECAME_14784 [Necator americanus]ETN70413.1 hypothetical protein NECAME_14784 [Necator americanus]